MNSKDLGSWVIVRDGENIGYLPGNIKDLSPALINKVINNYDNLKKSLDGKNIKQELKNFNNDAYKKGVDNVKTK